jgi:YhcH/YjgK/YiaL family protein
MIKWNSILFIEAAMIFDTLSHSTLYASITPRLKIAFDYLTSTDLAELPVGRIDLDGNHVYAMVQEYTTKPLEEGKWEAHRRYLDVQYMLRGSERIDFALLNSMKLGEYIAEKDFQAMSGSGNPLNLVEGSFVVFFPQDAHKPGLVVGAPSQVKKIVVKCEL